MTTISGKHVLILGSAMGLGAALNQQFDHGNQPASHLKLAELNWSDQASVEQCITNIKPTIIVNALALDLIQIPQDQHQAVVQTIGYLVKTCQQNSITLLQLSSYQVFAGSNKKAYDETDKVLAQDPSASYSPLAKDLVCCENLLLNTLEQFILLRFSWMIDAQGDNIFTDYLQQLYSTDTVEVDPSVKGAPLWLDDALRVVSSLVRQLLAGAENWGVFHYASADSCSEKDFAQQLIDTLGELLPGHDFGLISTPVAAQAKISGVLKCRRIRNNFGIHGRTWRRGLKARIQQWLESNTSNGEGGADIVDDALLTNEMPSAEALTTSDKATEVCAATRH